MTDSIRPPPRLPTPTPSSPPPAPPPPPNPSASYLVEAEQASEPLDDPSDLRKLLILDLNGSLLIRAAHVRGRPPSEGSAPRLRSTHPRPYLGAFRKYILSNDTREWLDVMVWSSAQPHSVTGMVDACFGGEQDKLVAVWARDTLGLSQADYHRKSATLKDLTKPWTMLGLKANGETVKTDSPKRSPRSRSLSPTPPSSQPVLSTTTAQQHSARTTLLLDDSPAKAALQPWNHVCLQEYSAQLRAADLVTFTHERAFAVAQKHEDQPEAQEAAGPTDADGTSQSKSQKKKEKKKKKALPASEASVSAYDETLLAIVGILDALKRESNVAGWIRAGGLWGPESIRPSTSEGGSVGAPGSETEGETAGASAAGAGATMVGGEIPERVPEEGNDAGNGVVSEVIPEVVEEKFSDTATVKADFKAAATLMWFEHPPTVAYWVERGRRACEELEIPVVHGIER